MKDAIDFRTGDIPTLFRQYLYPTLLGMVFSSVFVITDGIFIGKGVGSDALAAVNIVAPVYLLCTGIGLMFGMGGSVVASIHLARGRQKTANINVTQAVVVPTLGMVFLCLLLAAGAEPVIRWLGTPPELYRPVREYLLYLIPFFPFNMLFNVSMFLVRLNGFPRAVMACNIVAALLNIGLDYLFIFVFGWGLPGAAVATGIGIAVGTALLCGTILRRPDRIRFVRFKWSRNSLLLTGRNISYMARVGFPALLGDLAIACMMFVGNYTFVTHLGKDGVAAFSIACYLSPLIFMAYNAIVQSAQPIISFNYGCGETGRSRQTFRLALKTAALYGTLFLAACLLLEKHIVGLFLHETAAAYTLATDGFVLFALGFPFFGINMVVIGYYQSVERTGTATFLMLLRGVLLMTAAFVFLPKLFGVPGIWLAVPAAEGATALLVTGKALFRKGTPAPENR